MPKRPIQQSPENAKLLVSPVDANERIQARIAKGEELEARQISSADELSEATREFYTWSDYNYELLKRIFTNDSFASEYRGVYVGGGSSRSFPEACSEYRSDVRFRIRRLSSIAERLELIPIDETVQPSNSGSRSLHHLKRVFVVHGHDGAARESVARYIERLGLIPVILHEQPNAGRTIIEKFEAHSDVGYAVVLLTPDDLGRPAAAQTVVPRARQNVVFELGFFFGKLGRKHVCALHRDDVELPSDVQGLLYIALDTANGWQLQLAKEMKEAGLPIDMNRAI
jgi:predicted nucleotide-binding protein